MKLLIEPCPTCYGFCCVDGDEVGIHYEHMISACMTHVCDDCYDGTLGGGSDPQPAPKTIRTALDERKDVLAWLRDVSTSPTMSADEMVTLHWVARAIFGMEHVGAAAKEKP